MEKKFDKESFALFQQKDEQGFNMMYHCFYKLVRASTACLPTEDRMKKDIIHDTFQKAWAKSNTFENIPHLVSFLKITAVNASLSRLRAYTSEKKIIKGEANFRENADSEGDKEEEQTDTLRKLYKYLATLPPISLEIIKLAFWQNNSNAEIALKLGLSPNAIAIRKCRAIQLLKVQMVAASR